MTEDYIIDNYPYLLGKDLDGNKVPIKQIQEVIFSIILEIDRICRKNDIPYALAFGSALGIYNYQGFIPWDDDADIAIDYFDLSRLIDALKKDLSSEFEFTCYEIDDRYNILVPSIKVKKKTGFMEDVNHLRLKDRTGSYEGFFVDIVPFLGMGNAKKHRSILFKNQIRMVFYFISDFFFNHDPKKMKKKMKKEEKEIAELYKEAPYVCQTPVIPFQTPKINLYPRDVIFPFREYTFNGAKLYSFNNVKEFCRLRYKEKNLKKMIDGKYIDPWPKEKRKTIHVHRYSLNKQKP